MKTAFELANSDKPFTDRVLDIQEYAKQVSEQALKDVMDRLSDKGLTLDDYHTIKHTPIVTP